MKYCDMHCDALTTEGVAQVTRETLRAGGCFLQCFAAFISAKEGRYRTALSLADRFDALCEREGYHAVRSVSDLREGSINALFTVEGGGACEGSLEKLNALYGRGARMMTLTWNHPNEIGFPNFPDFEGLRAGRVPLSRRETERGLTPFGFALVERTGELGMIADVSHGSDKLFSDVAAWSKRSGIPFVASHSGAASVFDCARNLTDGQIRMLADCGGVAGLDFCARFLSADESAEGQRRAVLSHARAILKAGGEDVLAVGSDFDGIPENAYLKSPAEMPRLFDEFEKEFGARITEKFASGNFLRVFRAVCR